MNEIYAQAFGGHAPARATIVERALPLGARVEIKKTVTMISSSTPVD